MTSAITTTKLNNIEEMISSVSKYTADKSFAMDKSCKDFKKIFENITEKEKNFEGVNKGVNKGVNTETNREASREGNYSPENRINDKLNNNTDHKLNSQEVKKDIEEFAQNVDKKASNLKEVISKTLSAIKDAKENSSTAEDATSWAEFKEELANIISEANIETSLDLTLAKDINEIITQLQDAIESTSESIEGLENAMQEDLVNEENNSEVELPYEQIIAMLNKPVKIDLPSEFSELKDALVDKSSDESNTEVFNTIETLENLPEENLVNKAEDTKIQDLENILEEDLLKELNIESVKTEADMSSGSESFFHNQTAEEHSIKAMITKEVEVFDIKVESTQNISTTQTTQQVQTKTIDINPSRIIEQISKQLEGLQTGSKVNIVLNPESLGKVNIQLLSTKEGLTAQLTVSNQEARDLLMKGLDGLKDALTAQGVAFDNVSVKVANAEKSEYNQDWTEQEGSRGGNKGQKNPDREEKEKGLFEQMMAQELDLENGNV